MRAHWLPSTVTRRRGGAALALALAAGAGACHGPPPGPAPRGAGPTPTQVAPEAPAGPVETVDAVMLYTGATPFSAEGAGQPDAIQVGLMFFRQAQTASVAIHQGTVEFLLFEGRQSPADVATKPPFHTWTFTPEDLVANAQRSVTGFGYQMVLSWGGQVPSTKAVTLVARFEPIRGKPVYSAPVPLLLGPG